MPVYHMYAWNPWRPQKGVRTLEARITNRCQPQCGCLVSLDPLQEWPVLLTAEPFLQPSYIPYIPSHTIYTFMDVKFINLHFLSCTRNHLGRWIVSTPLQRKLRREHLLWMFQTEYKVARVWSPSIHLSLCVLPDGGCSVTSCSCCVPAAGLLQRSYKLNVVKY